MLTEKRKYNYAGLLNLHKSIILDHQTRPKDDKVNWLFLSTGKQQFNFIYKILKPQNANYNIPFEIQLSFTMMETVSKIIKLNHSYEIQRGQELIGTLLLLECLK